MTLPSAIVVLALAGADSPRPEALTVTPVLESGHETEWSLARGTWTMDQGVLRQACVDGGSVAILKEPSFTDFVMTVDVNIRPEGHGVRAAALVFRATGAMTYYWVHMDSKNNAIILVRSTPGQTWGEITRRPLRITDDAWHAAQIKCEKDRITLWLDGKEVLTARDSALPAGRVGLGTSQGRVRYRNLKIEGEVERMADPLKDESPLYKVISRGERAGPYQAFPDVCRLKNGDILCVFYAGYGHVA